MKQRLLDFLDAHLGKVLLALALVWTGWIVYVDWYKPLPKNLTEIEKRPLYVELDNKARSPAAKEAIAQTDVPRYRDPKTKVFITEVEATQFRPVELDIPPVTVKRAPQLLPEGGPSLEGAEKLPRFGEELPPPSPADLPPSTAPKAAPPVQAKF